VWSLLKKAGLQAIVSDVSDGTAGKVILRGGTLRCTARPDDGSTTCDLDGK
jgi:hypothetical protein